MREYEDPQHFMERYIDSAAMRYADGFRISDIQPSQTLIQALAERTVETAREEYRAHAKATFEHNIALIHRQHLARMKQINRDGAKLALWTCLPAIAFFGTIGWLQPDWLMRLIYWLGALAFLTMLIAALWMARK